MKNKWENKKIGEILRLEYGKSLPKHRRSSEGKYPVYGSNGVMTFSNKFYYDQPSIIVGRKGSAGELTLTEPKFWPLDVTYFVVYNKDDYDLKFLYYLLSVQQLFKLVKGVKPGINRNDVYAIDVCVPPLSEQQRIVEKLDQAFETIDKSLVNVKKNITNIQNLFQVFIENIYSNPGKNWEEKTFGEIAEVKGGKRVPKGYSLNKHPTAHPYIRVTDFDDIGSIDFSDIHYISDEVYKQIKNYTISKNDLYISIAGTIGKTGIVPEELNGANLTENACKLIFNEEIYPKYIYYFTKSQDFLNQAGLNTRTTTMPKLALKRLKTIKLRIPISISEQKEIVEKINELNIKKQKLIECYLREIQLLDELRKSILNENIVDNGEQESE